MPGPPKKPTELKLIEGTYRSDRVSKNEPKPILRIPKAPKHLSAVANKEWLRLSEELASLGLLSNIDRAALAAYCEAYADWVTASIKIEEFKARDEYGAGMIIKTQAGNIIENPFFSIKKRSMELMHKFLVEFGMTPASRTRIEIMEREKQNNDDPARKYFG